MMIRKVHSATALAICLAATWAGTVAYSASASDPSKAAPVKFAAPAGTYMLDGTHTSFLWSVKHMGLSDYTARFNSVKGTLQFDPADVTKSKIELTIDPRSVDANFSDAMYKTYFPNSAFTGWSDEIGSSPNYLDGKTHPAITFKSTSVKVTGARTGAVTGDLTFRGVTKPVTLAVTFGGDLAKHPMANVPAIGFGAEGVIKRSDFGVAPNLPAFAVGDDVTIRFQGEFMPPPPAAAAAK